MSTKRTTAEPVADTSVSDTPTNYYRKLNGINIASKINKKGNLSYLSWANAWDLLKSEYPDAQRVIYESPHTGLNYFTDGKTAYVKVGILVNGIEHIDMLPVMDFRNNSIPLEKVTSHDVNKTIQRSTAKAIAMHGIGIQLWIKDEEGDARTAAPSRQPAPKVEELINLTESNKQVWAKVTAYIDSVKENLPFEKIINNLKTKYKINEETNIKLQQHYSRLS